MPATDPELGALIDAAEDAYRRVHTVIVERIPAPGLIDLTQLDINQRVAIEELRRAEQALAKHREQSYLKSLV